jgi:hypothetical protein
MRLFRRRRIGGQDGPTPLEWIVQGFLSGEMAETEPNLAATTLLLQLSDYSAETAIGPANMRQLQGAMDATGAEWQERGIPDGDKALLSAYIFVCDEAFKDKHQGGDTIRHVDAGEFSGILRQIREGLSEELDRQLRER